MILIILMVFYSSVRRVGYYQEREEFRMAREKLGMLLHRMLVVLLPFAILSVVLSENLSILLLGDTGAEASGAMQAGSIGILFGTLGYVFILLLMRLKQSMLAAVSAGAAMVLQMVLLVIMTSAGVGGALAPALSQMFFYVANGCRICACEPRNAIQAGLDPGSCHSNCTCSSDGCGYDAD